MLKMFLKLLHHCGCNSSRYYLLLSTSPVLHYFSPSPPFFISVNWIGRGLSNICCHFSTFGTDSPKFSKYDSLLVEYHSWWCLVRELFRTLFETVVAFDIHPPPPTPYILFFYLSFLLLLFHLPPTKSLSTKPYQWLNPLNTFSGHWHILLLPLYVHCVEQPEWINGWLVATFPKSLLSWLPFTPTPPLPSLSSSKKAYNRQYEFMNYNFFDKKRGVIRLMEWGGWVQW